jgi:para-aminobenzoate synthetase component 1
MALEFREPLVEELVPAPDPIECCARLAGLGYRTFLDSARDPRRLGRYSFLTGDPVLLLSGSGGATERGLPSDGSLTTLPGHALAAARSILQQHAAEPIQGVPPFQGGFAGYIGYDWGAALERLPSSRYDDLAIPDVMLGLYDWVLSWDHIEHRAWIVSTGLPAAGAARARRAAERLTAVKEALQTDAAVGPIRNARPLFPQRHAIDRAPSFPVADVECGWETQLRSSFTHQSYAAAVRRVREYILAGDIFQANLSQRLEAPLRESPWTLYRRLRSLNPAPFAAYLDFDDVVVVSASPERFLSVTPDGQVEARPIKGTRPRGLSPEHDAALGRALWESEKDRAENLMIVDLLRNDLSRACEPGTVRVPELFELEHYSTVHHLVSTVIGKLMAGKESIDLLCAAFPGGSITGAPKVRAMEIIAELEPSRRGVYCGTLGYMSVTGAMDTSIVIRTYLIRRSRNSDRRAYFSVGGGIVADSDPEQEYQETLDKARALIAALAA